MIHNEQIKALYMIFTHASGVSTDTRQIKKKELFFALSGPNFDANDFVDEALKKKAYYVVGDSLKLKNSPKYFYVENCLEALQQLALFHRRKSKIPVIGITGSNGKTTTKELTALLLRSKYHVYATEGNLNNHIGVPLTLLRITKKTKIAIVEMGANKKGDIEELCQIACPNHGLITNVGKAHTKGFGGYQGVIKGKSELYQFLFENNGRIFVNSDDKVLMSLVQDHNKLYKYPKENDYITLKIQDLDPFLVLKGDDNLIIHTLLIGSYNFTNVAAAICIASFFGVSMKKIKTLLQKYKPKNNRSQLIKTHNNILVLDAYNSNPSSMEVALSNLDQIEVDKKSVILGDMLELENEEDEHRFLGKTLNDKMDEYNYVIFVGKLMKYASQQCEKSLWFADVDSLCKALKKEEIQLTGNTILIKGSRLMTLEELTDFL